MLLGNLAFSNLLSLIPIFFCLCSVSMPCLPLSVLYPIFPLTDKNLSFLCILLFSLPMPSVLFPITTIYCGVFMVIVNAESRSLPVLPLASKNNFIGIFADNPTDSIEFAVFPLAIILFLIINNSSESVAFTVIPLSAVSGPI